MAYKPDPPKGTLDDDSNRKVWDRCQSCFDKIALSDKEWDWRQCKRCRFISKSLIVALTVGALLAIWELWSYTKFENKNLDLYTLGYLVDIVGGWFLAAGLSDLFALSSSAFGGGGVTFARFGKTNFYRRAIGLFLLTLGFVFQCVANITTYQKPNIDPAPQSTVTPWLKSR
jgi:hypothetical protein